MKIKSLVIAAALSGVLVSSASAAITLTPVTVKAAAPVTLVAPVPTHVVQPVAMPYSHKTPAVTLTMNIDAAGKPSNIRVASTRDQDAYKQLVAAVSQWKFAPARKNGQAVASKVELPLEVKGL